MILENLKTWTFSDWGSFASILGFLFTIAVLIKTFLINSEVKRLKSKLLFNLTVSGLLDKIEIKNSTLLDIYESKNMEYSKIKLELGEIQVLFDSLSHKVEEGLKNDCQKLRKKIAKSLTNLEYLIKGKNKKYLFITIASFNKEELFNLYSVITLFMKKIKLDIEDRKKVKKYV